MVLGYLLMGMLAGLAVAVIALFAGVSPWLALAIHAAVGTGVVLLVVLTPGLRAPPSLVALATSPASRPQARS